MASNDLQRTTSQSTHIEPTRDEEYASIVPTSSRPHIRPQTTHQSSFNQILSETTSRLTQQRSSRRRYSFSSEEVPDDEWDLSTEVKKFSEQSENDKAKGKRLGVTWTDLTVKGVGADAAIQENYGSQFNPLNGRKEKKQAKQLKTLIDNSHGCVKPGEMLLVLGRPGSGCTTLLKVLSNHREGYAEVTGDVHWGSLDEKQAQQYRGQIVMNTEEELFFPTLTVGQTIDFATRMKVPGALPSNLNDPVAFQQMSREFLLKSMGIHHTSDTKVGDEFVRGVSGGERKRVSIIETLATRGSVYMWDNSTRGLDASTALQYTKAIRALTDIFGLASVVTLYQAGNGIYNLFDKTLVLDQGKQIYYGPLKDARPFMESIGFECVDGANVADFLTGVTVPSERRILDGHEDSFPRTASDIRAAYEKSDIFTKMQAEYSFPTSDEAKSQTEDFKLSVKADQAKGLPKNSPLTVSFQDQVKACVTRQYQILWGDKATLVIKQVGVLIQALVAGSLFYNAPNTSSGLFVKSGALFISLLFNSLLAMSEVTDSFSGRPVLAKHKAFALYHPAAFCIAQILTDIPTLIFQVSHFSLVIYFMVGLKVEAGAFFTYWLIVFTVAMVMTALFRAVGAAFKTFDDASKVSGFLIAALIMYTGKYTTTSLTNGLLLT